MTEHQLAHSLRRISDRLASEFHLTKETSCGIVAAALRTEADKISPKPEPREWDAWLSGGTLLWYKPCAPHEKIKVREVLP